MSEVLNNAGHDFWSPPAIQEVVAVPGMVEVCDGCEAEFMVGARFCHVCGAERHAQTMPGPVWQRYLAHLRVLEFHNVQTWLGLPLASLIAFLAGVGCLLGAIGVGVVYSSHNFSDFQAIQLYRLQWLLGAVAAFVAGILLKSSGQKAK